MRVKMVRHFEASPNGRHTELFRRGIEYDVSDRLGSIMLELGVATRLSPEPETTGQTVPNNAATAPPRTHTAPSRVDDGPGEAPSLEEHHGGGKKRSKRKKRTKRKKGRS